MPTLHVGYDFSSDRASLSMALAELQVLETKHPAQMGRMYSNLTISKSAGRDWTGRRLMCLEQS